MQGFSYSQGFPSLQRFPPCKVLLPCKVFLHARFSSLQSFSSLQGFSSMRGFSSSQVFPPCTLYLPCKVFLLFLARSLLAFGSRKGRDGDDTPKKPPSLLGDPQTLPMPVPETPRGRCIPGDHQRQPWSKRVRRSRGRSTGIRGAPLFLRASVVRARVNFIYLNFLFLFFFYFSSLVIPSSCHGSPGSGAAPNKAPGASRAPRGGFAAAPRSVTDRE